MYIAYLDEFGHIGPFASRSDPKYNTHPSFGLCGVVIPAERARELAMFFFSLKTKMLDFEIQRDGLHAARWEKKGSALLTTRNVTQYPEVRRAMNRILNWITRHDGAVFYAGVEKELGDVHASTEALYARVLRRSIRNIGRAYPDQNYMIVLDEQGKVFREKAVAAAGSYMFSNPSGFHLLEPPMQVESHLYQTVQCADWICALVGRLAAYRASTEFAEFEWAERYFGSRIAAAATRNSRISPRTSNVVQPALPTLDTANFPAVPVPKPGSWLTDR